MLINRVTSTENNKIRYENGQAVTEHSQMMSTIKIPNNNAMLQGLTSSPSNFDVNVDEQDIPQVVISDSLLVK